MFGGGVSSSLAGSSVAEKNLDRYTVLVGIVWFACIVGWACGCAPDERRRLTGPVRSYDLRAVRYSTGRAQVFVRRTASPAAHPVAAVSPADDRSEQPCRVATPSVAPGRIRPDAADERRNRPAPHVTYWCANGHRVELPFRRRGGPAGPLGLPALRPPAGQDAQTAGPGPDRAVQVAPGIREGAAHAEAGRGDPRRGTGRLRHVAAGPTRSPFPPGRGNRPGVQRRLRSPAGTSAAAARSSSHSVRSTPCTPAAGTCTGPRPPAPCRPRGALSAPAGDQPDLLGGVDRRQGERDPHRRRLGAAPHRADRPGLVARPGAPGRPTPRDRPRRRRASARRSGAARRARAGPRAASSSAYRAAAASGSSPSGPSEAGIGWTRAGSSGTASSRAARAWVSLRSGSPAGRNRSSPHQMSTRDQSTASRAGRRHRPVDRRGDPAAGQHHRRLAPVGLGVQQPHHQPGRHRLRRAGRRRRARRHSSHSCGLRRPTASRVPDATRADGRASARPTRSHRRVSALVPRVR